MYYGGTVRCGPPRMTGRRRGHGDGEHESEVVGEEQQGAAAWRAGATAPPGAGDHRRGTVTGTIGISESGGSGGNSGLVAASGAIHYWESYRDTALNQTGGSFTNSSSGTLAGSTGVTLGSGTLLNQGSIPGLRGAFHNADEFRALYPDYETPAAPALCAPRPEAGPALEAALAPVLARLQVVAGRLRGFIDILGPDKVEGWAWDEANPDLPVALEIWAGAEQLGTVLACHYRPDLAASGLGRGHCMFSHALPEGLSGTVTVRRGTDGTVLAPTQTCRAVA